MTTDMLAILLISFITPLFCTGLILGTLLFISRDTTKIPELVSRLVNVERITSKLAEDVNSEIGPGTERWRSADGRYEASSFEELLSNMATDPDGPLDQDEIDAIKSVFEKIMKNNNDEPKNDWEK